MKKSSVLAITIGLAFVVVLGLVAHTPQREINNMHASGAFRDGLYQAKLDAQSGRKAAMRTGRWRTDADRAAFVAGYQQGSESAPAVTHLRSGQELVGFRDGVADGAEARRSDRPFALRNGFGITQGQSTAGRVKDAEYVQAYASGYQYGYYADPETLSTEISSRSRDQF